MTELLTTLFCGMLKNLHVCHESLTYIIKRKRGGLLTVTVLFLMIHYGLFLQEPTLQCNDSKATICPFIQLTFINILLEVDWHTY